MGNTAARCSIQKLGYLKAKRQYLGVHCRIRAPRASPLTEFPQQYRSPRFFALHACRRGVRYRPASRASKGFELAKI
jgi:hypothetical protein